MSRDTDVIEEFHRQIDKLAPSIMAGIRRGERQRIKLYTDGEKALEPQYTPLGRGGERRTAVLS